METIHNEIKNELLKIGSVIKVIDLFNNPNRYNAITSNFCVKREYKDITESAQITITYKNDVVDIFIKGYYIDNITITTENIMEVINKHINKKQL
jgi:hypothetical protein